MSPRLGILFEEEELEEIRQAARRERLTVAEWVRRALREALSRKPRLGVEGMLAALERAVQHDCPTGDVDRMLAEIEAGYLGRR